MNEQHPHIASLACDLAAMLAPLSKEERAREMDYFLNVLAAEHELTIAPIDSTMHVLTNNRRHSLRVLTRQITGAGA